MTNIMSKNDDITIFGGSGEGSSEDLSSFWYDTYPSSQDTISIASITGSVVSG